MSDSVAVKTETADKLFRVLETGIRWIYSPPKQPKGALISHHGIGAKDRFFDTYLSICPQGFEGKKVVVSFSNERPFVNKGLYSEREPIPPDIIKFMKDTVSSAAQRIEAGIEDQWGEGVEFLSLSLNRIASPDILALVAQYHKGCHDGKLHGHYDNSVFCERGWYNEGYQKVVLPEGWE